MTATKRGPPRPRLRGRRCRRAAGPVRRVVRRVVRRRALIPSSRPARVVVRRRGPPGPRRRLSRRGSRWLSTTTAGRAPPRRRRRRGWGSSSAPCATRRRPRHALQLGDVVLSLDSSRVAAGYGDGRRQGAGGRGGRQVRPTSVTWLMAPFLWCVALFDMVYFVFSLFAWVGGRVWRRAARCGAQLIQT